MFTGIIEELGEVAAIEDQGDAVRIAIACEVVRGDAAPGDSIAVNGCCLTVAGIDDCDQRLGTFTADVMAETLDRTTIGTLAVGDPVNLERAVTVEKRLGGHIVQGHVDGVGTVTARHPSEHWDVIEIALPTDRDLGRYLVDKGSVTVDGTSLTVVEARDDAFTISLIPETLARTTLGTRRPGDPVNLEVDVLAKHVEKLLSAYTGGEAGAGRLDTPLVPRGYSTTEERPDQWGRATSESEK